MSNIHLLLVSFNPLQSRFNIRTLWNRDENNWSSPDFCWYGDMFLNILKTNKHLKQHIASVDVEVKLRFDLQWLLVRKDSERAICVVPVTTKSMPYHFHAQNNTISRDFCLKSKNVLAISRVFCLKPFLRFHEIQQAICVVPVTTKSMPCHTLVFFGNFCSEIQTWESTSFGAKLG